MSTERRMSEEERLSFISHLLTTVMNMMSDRKFYPVRYHEREPPIDVWRQANRTYVMTSEDKMVMREKVLDTILEGSLSEVSSKLKMSFRMSQKGKGKGKSSIVRMARVFFLLADDMIKATAKGFIDEVLDTITEEVEILDREAKPLPHEYILIIPSNLRNFTHSSSLNVRKLKELLSDGPHRITVFTAASLLSNPTRHFIMPYMRVMRRLERDRHVKRMLQISSDLSPENYPKIRENDVVVKYLGARAGDIMEIIDKKDFTVTSMSSKRWRVVTKILRSVEEESLLMM
jgi:DNA-directed RNA polymerase subunit H (RpoH/RPB5)